MMISNRMLICVVALALFDASLAPTFADECDDLKTMLDESLASLRSQHDRLVRMKPQPRTDAAICRTASDARALWMDMNSCPFDLFDSEKVLDRLEESEKIFHCPPPARRPRKPN
jgi:hypothetical protein